MHNRFLLIHNCLRHPQGDRAPSSSSEEKLFLQKFPVLVPFSSFSSSFISKFCVNRHMYKKCSSIKRGQLHHPRISASNPLGFAPMSTWGMPHPHKVPQKTSPSSAVEMGGKVRCGCVKKKNILKRKVEQSCS